MARRTTNLPWGYLDTSRMPKMLAQNQWNGMFCGKSPFEMNRSRALANHPGIMTTGLPKYPPPKAKLHNMIEVYLTSPHPLPLEGLQVAAGEGLGSTSWKWGFLGPSGNRQDPLLLLLLGVGYYECNLVIFMGLNSFFFVRCYVCYRLVVLHQFDFVSCLLCC